MKKILFFAAVLATALVSCSSDDSNSVANENKKPAEVEVKSLGMSAAGTTMTITAGAKTRTVNTTANPNTVALAENGDLTIQITPVLASNVTAYTIAADGYMLRCRPYDPTSKEGYDHIYADITKNHEKINYVKVENGNSINLSITGAAALFAQDVKGKFTNFPDNAAIDEWTYEVYLYPEATDNDGNTINPMPDLTQNATYEWGNLIGGAPFINRPASTCSVKDRWGNEYTYENPAYKEATPAETTVGGYKVRTMVYQGYCAPRVAASDKSEAYDYNYSYIKCSIHISPVPAAE